MAKFKVNPKNVFDYCSMATTDVYHKTLSLRQATLKVKALTGYKKETIIREIISAEVEMLTIANSVDTSKYQLAVRRLKLAQEKVF